MSGVSSGPEGMILGGRYRIVKLIGSGGMANVYLANDMSSGARVAIKILKSEYSADTEFIKRFDTEAKAAASLSHANIVRVLGIGQEGSYRYMVQEYIEGITVKDLINQNGHLDWKVAVPIAIQVGMALDHAHQHGIVHRDIKPHNILISKERIAKVTDFGIARAATSNTITLTSGGALGSVHYFSPEQARGAMVGPSSDIYSLGVMLFEMLTGRVPFDGDTPVAVAVKHLQENVPLASGFIPGVPAGLDAIIQKSMQKGVEFRYSSVREMVSELDALMVDPNGAYGVVSKAAEAQLTEHMPSMRQEPNYGKINDIERSIDKRRRSRLKDNILVIVLVAVIVGILIGIVSLVFRTIADSMALPTSDVFVVDDYVGRTIQEVVDDFRVVGFENYEVEYHKRSDYSENIIYEQNFSPGTEIRTSGSLNTLILRVSVLEDSHVLDEYREMDVETVRTLLTASGFVVTTRPEITDDYPPGTVIRTEPVAGTAVRPGDVIILVYSQQSETVTVPQLINLTLETAEQLIDENELIIGMIEMSPTAEDLSPREQYVLLTDPPAGTVVNRRSSIKLYVGTAEDAQRGGTPTPTPDLEEYSVELSRRPEEAGQTIGGGTYLEQSIVTVRAIPNDGFRFVRWIDSNSVEVSRNIEYQFEMPSNDYQLTAQFESIPATPTPEQTATPTPEDSNGDDTNENDSDEGNSNQGDD